MVAAQLFLSKKDQLIYGCHIEDQEWKKKKKKQHIWLLLKILTYTLIYSFIIQLCYIINDHTNKSKDYAKQQSPTEMWVTLLFIFFNWESLNETALMLL